MMCFPFKRQTVGEPQHFLGGKEAVVDEAREGWEGVMGGTRSP